MNWRERRLRVVRLEEVLKENPQGWGVLFGLLDHSNARSGVFSQVYVRGFKVGFSILCYL